MIGARLKELRLKAKNTQADVAKYLSISQQAYNYYENDKRIPDYPTLLKLADYYSVPVSYILGEETTTNKETTISNHNIDGYEELNQEDRQRVAEYVALLKLKYKNEKK